MKIVHISDIHCRSNPFNRGSTKWEREMEPLVRFLHDISPEILVITGDLMDAPLRWNLNILKRWLQYLDEVLESKTKIISVPGNHDYYWLYGNNAAGRSRKWHRNEALFQRPVQSIELTVKGIYEAYNIAFYPLDSNSLRLFGFAKGRVRDPVRSIQRIDDILQNGNSFNPTLKIALLHHHLLPVPSSVPIEEKLESGLLLENSFSVLRALLDANIDIALHGHKHKFGFARYAAPWGGELRSIQVSSSRSSYPGFRESGLNVIELDDNGEVKLVPMKKADGGELFERELPQVIRSYESVRKAQASDQQRFLFDGFECSVGNLEKKTKRVDIHEDGSASIWITYNHISWKEPCRRFVIEEFLRGGIGRIRGMSFALYNGDYTKDPNEISWSRRKGKGPYSCEPDKLEGFKVRVFRDDLNASEKAHCDVHYQLFNGFCLDSQDFVDLYCEDIPAERRGFELCSIYANAPTEVLELIIEFPTNESFPADHSNSLICWRNPTPNSHSFDFLDIDKQRDHSEEGFLKSKAVTRIFRNKRQIVVTIRHPLPGINYSFRWRLPEAGELSREIPGTALTAIEEVRNTLKTDDTRAKKAVRQLKEKIENTFDKTTVDVMWFGIDCELSKFCNVVPNDQRKHIRLGRGAIGLAYRQRRAVAFLDSVTQIANPELELAVVAEPPACLLAIPLLIHDASIEPPSRHPVGAVVAIVEKERGPVGEGIIDPNKREKMMEEWTNMTLGVAQEVFPELSNTK